MVPSGALSNGYYRTHHRLCDSKQFARKSQTFGIKTLINRRKFMSNMVDCANFSDFHQFDEFLDFLADCNDVHGEFDFNLNGKLPYHKKMLSLN